MGQGMHIASLTVAGLSASAWLTSNTSPLMGE